MNLLRMACWSLKSNLRNQKRLFLCGVLATVLIWLMFSQKTAHLRQEVNILKAELCSNADSRQIIEATCSLYKNKEIVGDLCEPLCGQQLVQFVRCLNYKHGKYVFEVECNDFCQPHVMVTAVLKMTQQNASNLQRSLKEIDSSLLTRMQLQEEVGKMDIHEYTITARSLSLLLQDLLDAEYGFTPREGQDMLSMLWNDNYANYFSGEKTTLLFARSFWSVVNQNEYRISKVFNDWEVFPRIYGSCGALYLSENAPGLKTSSSWLSYFLSSYPSWSSRAKTAIAILNLVQRMETMEHPLHLCDVKSPHFGIMPDNSIKFIDADTVFADEALRRELEAPNCTKHEDCAFFDCEGWCKKETGRCSPLRTNNNLQMVCAKIFRGSPLSGHTGLLSSPPSAVAAELTRLVNSCADDITDVHQGEVKMKTPDLGFLSKLSEYLLESLNADIKS